MCLYFYIVLSFNGLTVKKEEVCKENFCLLLKNNWEN